VTESDRIKLDKVDAVAATYLSRKGAAISLPHLTWPGPNPAWPEPFDRVQPASAQLAAKLYASGLRGGTVAIGHGRQWLRISWDETIEDLGIWLNFGGWPAPGETRHIALEPTSAPVDHLGQALARSAPTAIAPGESRTWMVTMRVGAEHAFGEQNT
jgi:hypothetical protein